MNTDKRLVARAVLGAVALLATGTTTLAQSDPDLSWNTVDGGGVFSSGSTSLSMSATLGQPDVGGMTSGDLSLIGGFWAILPDGGYCMADWDGSGTVDPADVAAFVQAWFSDLVNGTLVADMDGNGAVEPSDVAMFIAAWFNALSTGGC